MTIFKPTSLLDKFYEVGLFVKGFDGTLELIGGVLLLLVSPATVNHLTAFLTQRELSEDPHDFIATHIVHYGNNLAAGHNLFAALFLLTHGAVKVGLVTALLLNKLWAYPLALVALLLFLVYQIYQLIVAPSFGMALLTVLDVIIIWLIWREWQKIKSEPAPVGT
jgi:uncharacterized membrane protein